MPKDIPLVDPGGSRTLLSAELANQVIAAGNCFLGLQVDPPLRLDKSGAVWRISLDADPDADLPRGAATGYANTDQTYTASCPYGTTGAPVTVTVAAGSLFSPTSTSDANSIALQLATAQATAGLACSLTASTGFNDTVSNLLLLSTGNLLATGQFSAYQGIQRTAVAVLYPNLGLHPADWFLTGGTSLNAIAEAATGGDFYAFGNATTWEGVTQLNGGRLAHDGTLDTAFAWSGFNNTLYAPVWNGTYLLLFTPGGGASSYATHTVDGWLGFLVDNTGAYHSRIDTANNGNSASSCQIVGGSAYFLTGSFGTFQGSAVNSRTLRLTGGLGRDLGWSEDPAGGFSGGGPTCCATDGTTYYLGGGFTGYAAASAGNLVACQSNGTKKTSFATAGGGANAAVNAVALQSDGKIIIGGNFTTYNGTTRKYLARVNPDGTLDTGWAPAALNGFVYAVVILSDGTIIAAGAFTTCGGATRNRIARFTPAGTLLNP